MNEIYQYLDLKSLINLELTCKYLNDYLSAHPQLCCAHLYGLEILSPLFLLAKEQDSLQSVKESLIGQSVLVSKYIKHYVKTIKDNKLCRLSGLKSLMLLSAEKQYAKTLKYIFPKLKHLQQLTVSGSMNSSFALYQYLPKMYDLRKIDIDLKTDFIAFFEGKIQNFQLLEIIDIDLITIKAPEKDLKILSKLSSIKELSLNKCKWDETEYFSLKLIEKHLKTWNKIKKLSLWKAEDNMFEKNCGFDGHPLNCYITQYLIENNIKTIQEISMALPNYNDYHCLKRWKQYKSISNEYDSMIKYVQTSQKSISFQYPSLNHLMHCHNLQKFEFVIKRSGIGNFEYMNEICHYLKHCETLNYIKIKLECLEFTDYKLLANLTGNAFIALLWKKCDDDNQDDEMKTFGTLEIEGMSNYMHRIFCCERFWSCCPSMNVINNYIVSVCKYKLSTIFFNECIGMADSYDIVEKYCNHISMDILGEDLGLTPKGITYEYCAQILYLGFKSEIRGKAATVSLESIDEISNDNKSITDHFNSFIEELGDKEGNRILYQHKFSLLQLKIVMNAIHCYEAGLFGICMNCILSLDPETHFNKDYMIKPFNFGYIYCLQIACLIEMGQYLKAKKLMKHVEEYIFNKMKINMMNLNIKQII